MSTTPLRLQSLLGDYPNTCALKNGAVRSQRFTLDFADVKAPSKAFKRVVRNLEFDIAELAIVTYLTAMSKGLPLVLLPVVVRGNFLHESIVCRAGDRIDPANLKGKRIGIRSHTVTTVTWVRGLLQNEFGLDLRSVNWVAFEESHVAGITDIIGSEQAPEGKDMLAMLASGELDAAITGSETLGNPAFRPLIPEIAKTVSAWFDKYQTVPINHMVVVRQSLLDTDSGLAAELFELFCKARSLDTADAGGIDRFPLGVDTMHKSLELIITYAHQQGLIPRAYAVDELFNDQTRNLSR